MVGDIVEAHDIDEFRALAGEWDACLATMLSPSLFNHSVWLSAWWSAFGQGRKLHVVVVKSGSEILAGAALCGRRARYYRMGVSELHFVGEPAADRQEFICRPGAEEAVDRIWDHLRIQTQRYDLVRLEEIPQTSSTVTRGRRCGARPEVEISSCLPYIANPGDWKTFERSLRRRFRAEMRSRDKVFASWGTWRLEVHEGNAVAAYLDELRQTERSSQKDRGGYAFLAEDGNWALVSDLARAQASPIEPLLLILRVGDTPIAYTLGFVFDGKYHGYNTAFRSGFEKGSPGKWIIHQTIRLAFERGLREFDFLRGGMDLKARWQPSARRNVRMVLFASGARTAALRFAVFRIRPILKNLRLQGGFKRPRSEHPPLRPES